MPVISFTTDYGLIDAFVAACHGVALTLAPDVRIVDVTHLVPPGDVRRGAIVLADAVPYFPPGSVHVAVVDPGVGTSRRSLVVATPGGLLVGPDNGLLLPAASALGGVTGAFEVSGWHTGPSRTFHGRDLFMPVAARLSSGLPVASVGPSVDGLVELPAPVLRLSPGRLEAEVRSVDRFGSLQLSASASDLDAVVPVGGPVQVNYGDGDPLDVVRRGTFGEVPSGSPLVLVDSTGRAAVAVNNGSAAELLGVGVGEVLVLVACRG